MITLNGNKFAANESEFKDSLFCAGSTCVGYYKVNKRTVTLKDHNKVKVGVISNNVCGTATMLNGQWWYSYGIPKVIGEWPTYSAQQEEIHAITQRFNLPVRT